MEKDVTAGELREALKHLPDDYPLVFTERKMVGGKVFYYDGIRSFTDAGIIYLVNVEDTPGRGAPDADKS